MKMLLCLLLLCINAPGEVGVGSSDTLDKPGAGKGIKGSMDQRINRLRPLATVAGGHRLWRRATVEEGSRDQVTPAQNYHTGDTLYVVAQSGLRLRTAPNSDAGTIRVLECGEPVIVTNTFNFDSAHRDRSGWFNGYWIYVRSNLGSGYVFDAFLTSLELPSHEDELAYESLRFTRPLHTYLRNHYPVIEDRQGIQSREDIDQCIMFHVSGITMTSTTGDGWHKTDVAFQGYRLSEVIQLFQSMIVGEDLVQAFQDSLRFHKDKHGELNKVVADTGSHRMTFEVQHGAVHVSYTEFTRV